MEPFKVYWILFLPALALGESSDSTTFPSTPSAENCEIANTTITVRKNQTCGLDARDLDSKQWHRLRLKTFTNCKSGDKIIINLRGTEKESREEWSCKDLGDTTSWFAKTVSISITPKGSWENDVQAILEIQSYPYMQWTYVVIRILIGLVFMMIPILVIFYFFFRRQVARNRVLLEEHIAQRRYSISVISHEDPRCAHDKPPMYEDLYDEPPPCFCQVVTIAPPHDGQNNTEGTGASSNEGYSCNCGKMPSAEPSRVFTAQQGDNAALSADQCK